MTKSLSFPIRVFHIISTPNRGGAETLIMNIYHNIDRSKIQFDFSSHSTEKSDYEDEIIHLGGNVYCFKSIREIGVLRFTKQYYDFFKINKYSIVHSHTCIYSLLPLFAAKIAGVKIRIVHSHGSVNRSKLFDKSKILFPIVKYLLDKVANVFFSCSSKASDFLFLNKRQRNGQIKIINNGIDTLLFKYNQDVRNQLRSELHVDNKFVVGHVGRLNHEKNHDFLLDIFYEIYNFNNDAVLLLVGVGELEEVIKNKVYQLNLQESVIFLGSRNDIYNVYNVFDVFVMPSLTEGFPLSVVEAQTSGLRCIIADTITAETQLTELVEFLSLNDSACKWAQKILETQAINNRTDRTEDIIKREFDIKFTSEYLQKFYLTEAHNDCLGR